MQEKTVYRISMGMSVLLIMTAVFFDTLSLIPFVGTIMGPIFWLGVGIYLWIKGMGIINGRKLAVVAVSFVAELVPIIQELPTLVVGIVILLFLIRIEDRTGLSIAKPISRRFTPPRQKRSPFNSQPGVRPPRKDVVV